MKGNRKGGVAVVQYTPTGIFVNEFTSILEAALSQRIKPTGISKCLREEMRTYKGSVWRYKDPSHPIGERRAKRAAQTEVSTPQVAIETPYTPKRIHPNIGSYTFVKTEDEKALLHNALASAIEWGNKN